MAYKLLKCVLPVDIVNIIVDYSVYYDLGEIHMYKIYNNAKLNHILYYYESGKNIERDKKYINDVNACNYAQVQARHMLHFIDIENMYKIVKYIPKDTINKQNHLIWYIRKHVLLCHSCGLNQLLTCIYYCNDCDFSQCKNNEIFKTVSSVH